MSVDSADEGGFGGRVALTVVGHPPGEVELQVARTAVRALGLALGHLREQGDVVLSAKFAAVTLGVAALRLTEVPEAVVLVGGSPLYIFLLRYQARREARTDQATRHMTD